MKSVKWVYILTGLGLFRKTKVAYPDIEEVVLEDIGVKLRRISLVEGVRLPRLKNHIELFAADDRFVFYINEGEKNDYFAQKFTDGVAGSLALANDTTTEEAFTSFCISEDIIKKGIFIRIKDIPGNHAIGSELYLRLMKCIGVTSEVLNYVWHIVPAIIKSESLMNGAHFYKESVGQVWIADDDVFEFMSDKSDTPFSQSDRACVESAYQNAFKAIESVIGEPPNDERKFRLKLVNAGINPDETVGFELYGMKPGKEAILKKIIDMQGTRDKKAAHGKTSMPRTIGYCELKDKQALARYIILSHIDMINKS